MSGGRVLDAIEHVRRAKARYCRFLDTKQWDEFAGLFVAEARIRIIDQHQQTLAEFDTRDAFVAAARSRLEGAQSSHHVHNDEIDLVSAYEISAIWAMEELIFVRAPRQGQLSELRGYGHFHDRWILTGGGWRLAGLELRRTILKTLSA